MRATVRRSRAGESLPEKIPQTGRATSANSVQDPSRPGFRLGSSEALAKIKPGLQPEARDERKFRNRTWRALEKYHVPRASSLSRTAPAPAARRAEWSRRNKPAIWLRLSRLLM